MNPNRMAPPSIADINRQYNSNLPNTLSVLNQPLYDTVKYPAAGARILQFFNKAQGGSYNGADVTLEDTNMLTPNALPNPQAFLVQAIELEILSTDYATHKALLGRGAVRFTYGSLNVYENVGIEMFPPENGIRLDTAVSAASDSTDAIEVENARFCGRMALTVPTMMLPTQNFSLKIEFPNGNVAIPQDTLIRARLLGWLYREAQA